MRKLSFLKPIWNVVLLVTMSLLFINCSSSHDDETIPSNNAAFNVADFALTVTSKKFVGDWLEIDFSVKNTSKISYSKYEQGNSR